MTYYWYSGVRKRDNFTDKRFFTDKPLIKTESDYF